MRRGSIASGYEAHDDGLSCAGEVITRNDDKNWQDHYAPYYLNSKGMAPR